MNKTALSAVLQTIVFASENHRDFYKEYLPQSRHQEVLKVGMLC